VLALATLPRRRRLREIQRQCRQRGGLLQSSAQVVIDFCGNALMLLRLSLTFI
jgi:hypothetical protein